MGNTRSLEGVRWMWNASPEPFSKSQPAEWRRFTDVETMIIEEAFQTGKNQAILDDCRIDLKKLIQISNNDTNRQRPVKRMIPNRDEIQIRVDRFLVNPIETDRSDGGQYGFISPFIRETVRYLKLIRDGLPSQDPSIVTMVVDKAVQGIIDEGRKVGKQNEGKILGRCLSEKRQAGIQHVWKCCVYLYSLESFLFQIIHETLRFIGNEEHEQLWKDRVKTLGPFCLLLWDNPFDSKPIQSGTQVYRGAEMSEELITKLKKDSAVVPKPIYSFQAFTSCTRNRTIAEKFGNVLFIMKIRVGFSIDLHSYSKYPHEEEEILLPGITYVINSVKFDATLKKHLITLTLQQKHNRKDNVFGIFISRIYSL